MPRPKRHKVAPSAPVQISRIVDKPAIQPSAAQKQKNPSSSYDGRASNGSEDSDGLVTNKNRVLVRRTPQASGQTMSGALPAEDLVLARSRRPSDQTTAALSRIVRDADHAKVAGEKAKKAVALSSQDHIPRSLSAQTFGAGIASTGALKGVSARQSIQQEGVGMGSQGTPQFQTSALGIGTFRKRTRQPSLLQLVHAQDNVSDEINDHDMDEFLPDDESTPLIKSLSAMNARSKTSSSQQTSGSRKRKLASPEVQVPSSQPFDLPPSPASSRSSRRLEWGEEPGEEVDLPEPTLPPLRRSHPPPPEIYSDTLAPPQSSSSPWKIAPRKTRIIASKAAKTRKKLQPPQRSRKRQQSSAPSPPSSTYTQVSPVRPAQPKPLTTARLQNLLPRRRARARPKCAYDIPSSSDVELDNTGLGEDEDELSFHATSKMRRNKSTTKAPNSVAKKKDKTMGPEGRRISRTYTRKSILEAVEGENASDLSDGEEDDEAVVQGGKKTAALDTKAKAEMERLRAKFNEVDDYTLDFEDMTGSSSQMLDAR